MELSSSNLEIDDVALRLDGFFRKYYHEKILGIARSYPDEKRLEADFKDLDLYDFALAEHLLAFPDETISTAEKVIRDLDLPFEGAPPEIHVAFYNLPEGSKLQIRDIRSDHVGRLISIQGVVRKATDIRPKLLVGNFECQRCGHTMRIPQHDIKLKEPYLCESCETRGPFKLLVTDSKLVNSQKIMVQESLEELRGREHPKQLTVFLEDDLTGRVMPGDKAEIAGVLRTRRNYKDKTRVFDIYLDALYVKPVEVEFEEVKISKEDEERILKLSKDPKVYDLIRDSIAPHIYGFHDIKTAIMYQLFSSPRIEMPDGGKIRGDSHILILGEPATGKSEILQYVAKELAPKGIFTSGKGATGAGLTATAVKDEFGDGGWSLEAGALVLADKGIACVDEFDKMSNEDRSAMHEAMEQQTVSVAKAGILAQFSARAAILAAANPKFGRFDQYKPISDQINLTPTIISRFDLIFTVRDDIDDTRQIAKHILDSVVSPAKVSPPISPDFFKLYVAYARQRCNPVLTEEAREEIEKYYVERREASRDQAMPLTARQLWAVIRIARASARVRLSDKVTVEDARNAIRLLDVSLRDVGLDLDTGTVDIDKLMTGVTKSQRDKIQIILGIIRELEKEYGPVKREEITGSAADRGIKPEEVDRLLEILKKNGEIYEPKPGQFKIV
ncbi:MAG: AAA family ATPase [Methanobacteriota archaeon]|nr:MAG: AAA family ATPase [Euryarchaeota archaeon]